MHAHRDTPVIHLLVLLAALSWLTAAGCAQRVRHDPGPSGQGSPPPSAAVPKPYRVNGVWYHPIPDATGFNQQGIASWYGRPFHGRRTSNGEIYDMYGLSAAHKTLPFGTVVRVRNLDNQRTLDLRINDRGPFARDRILDLSYGAAERLGVVGPGTARIELTVLAAPARTAEGAPVDLFSGNFTFQVGAFRDPSNAERYRRQLSERFPNVHIAAFDRGDGLFHRVRLGKVSDLHEAERFEADLLRQGFDVFIVAE